MADQVNEWLCVLQRDGAESRQAFENLYGAYYQPVFLLAVSITNDVSLAEDVAQEVFITVKRQAGRFRPESSGRAWILAITRNIARYYARTDRAEEYKMRQSGEACAAEFEKQVLDGIVISEAMERLNSAEYRTVLLHVFGGFTLREIASHTDTAYGTVLWRYHEARKKLKKYYEGMC